LTEFYLNEKKRLIIKTLTAKTIISEVLIMKNFPNARKVKFRNKGSIIFPKVNLITKNATESNNRKDPVFLKAI